MLEAVRSRLPMAIVMAMMLALTGGAALTQSSGQISPAAKQKINVDRVDGKHAVGATEDLAKRSGKLMALNSAGYLPSNIVDGGVATVAALQSSTGAVNEADNPVNWNQIQGVPAAVLAGDTTRSFIAQETGLLAVGSTVAMWIDQPIGLDVEWTLIPTVPGALVIEGGPGLFFNQINIRTAAASLRQFVVFTTAGVATAVKLRATVWNDSYLSPSAAKKAIKVTVVKNPKRVLKDLGLK